jgi:hypothetical protein
MESAYKLITPPIIEDPRLEARPNVQTLKNGVLASNGVISKEDLLSLEGIYLHTLNYRFSVK